MSRRWLGVVLVAFSIACGSRAESGATASPTALASVSASASPTASTTPTSSPRPNPTAGPGTYTNVGFAYRVELPAGWRRSSCQSTPEPVDQSVEAFTSASLDEESATDTGSPNDTVVVQVEQNPTNMSALAWLESGKLGHSTASHFERATIDGKEGARVVPNDGSPSLAFAVPARGRMYAVTAGVRTPGARQPAAAILASFHLLTDAELAEARTSLASAAPAAARSAESVAQSIAAGFAQKDASVLASVARECLTQAGENAGAGFMSSAKFFADLRTRFANGLAVTVQPTPLVDQQSTSAAIRGTWKDPGQAQRNVKFMLRKIGNTWYWDGVLYLLA
jgi:hypothetical protein